MALENRNNVNTTSMVNAHLSSTASGSTAAYSGGMPMFDPRAFATTSTNNVHVSNANTGNFQSVMPTAVHGSGWEDNDSWGNNWDAEEDVLKQGYEQPYWQSQQQAATDPQYGQQQHINPQQWQPQQFTGDSHQWAASANDPQHWQQPQAMQQWPQQYGAESQQWQQPANDPQQWQPQLANDQQQWQQQQQPVDMQQWQQQESANDLQQWHQHQAVNDREQWPDQNSFNKSEMNLSESPMCETNIRDVSTNVSEHYSYHDQDTFEAQEDHTASQDNYLPPGEYERHELEQISEYCGVDSNGYLKTELQTLNASSMKADDTAVPDVADKYNSSVQQVIAGAQDTFTDVILNNETHTTVERDGGTIPASSSFASLPFQPSAFDQIAGDVMIGSLSNSGSLLYDVGSAGLRQPALGIDVSSGNTSVHENHRAGIVAATKYAGDGPHSRQSSFGGESVQFVLGGGSASVSPSHLHRSGAMETEQGIVPHSTATTQEHSQTMPAVPSASSSHVEYQGIDAVRHPGNTSQQQGVNCEGTADASVSGSAGHFEVRTGMLPQSATSDRYITHQPGTGSNFASGSSSQQVEKLRLTNEAFTSFKTNQLDMDSGPTTMSGTPSLSSQPRKPAPDADVSPRTTVSVHEVDTQNIGGAARERENTEGVVRDELSFGRDDFAANKLPLLPAMAGTSDSACGNSNLSGNQNEPNIYSSPIAPHAYSVFAPVSGGSSFTPIHSNFTPIAATGGSSVLTVRPSPLRLPPDPGEFQKRNPSSLTEASSGVCSLSSATQNLDQEFKAGRPKDDHRGSPAPGTPHAADIQRSVTHHRAQARRDAAFSPSTTLWENPEPKERLHILPATPPVVNPLNVGSLLASQAGSNDSNPLQNTGTGPSRNSVEHPMASSAAKSVLMNVTDNQSSAISIQQVIVSASHDPVSNVGATASLRVEIQNHSVSDHNIHNSENGNDRHQTSVADTTIIKSSVHTTNAHISNMSFNKAHVAPMQVAVPPHQHDRSLEERGVQGLGKAVLSSDIGSSHSTSSAHDDAAIYAQKLPASSNSTSSNVYSTLTERSRDNLEQVHEFTLPEKDALSHMSENLTNTVIKNIPQQNKLGPTEVDAQFRREAGDVHIGDAHLQGGQQMESSGNIGTESLRGNTVDNPGDLHHVPLQQSNELRTNQIYPDEDRRPDTSRSRQRHRDDVDRERDLSQSRQYLEDDRSRDSSLSRQRYPDDDPYRDTSRSRQHFRDDRQRYPYDDRARDNSRSRQHYPDDDRIRDTSHDRQRHPDDNRARDTSLTRQQYPEDDRPGSRQGYRDDRPGSRYPGDLRYEGRDGYPDERSRRRYDDDRARGRNVPPVDVAGVRPASRQGYLGADDPRAGQRPGRDQVPGRPESRPRYPDDRAYYERPPSRAELLVDRPSSRLGQSADTPDDISLHRSYSSSSDQRGRESDYRSRQSRSAAVDPRSHRDGSRGRDGGRDDDRYRHRTRDGDEYDRPRSRTDDDWSRGSRSDTDLQYFGRWAGGAGGYPMSRREWEEYQAEYYRTHYYNSYYNYYYGAAADPYTAGSQYPGYYADPHKDGYEDEMKRYKMMQEAGGVVVPGAVDPYAADHRHSLSSRGQTPNEETSADVFAYEFHRGSRPGSRLDQMTQPSPVSGDHRYMDGQSYGYPLDDPTSSFIGTSRTGPAARMTPHKFTRPHVRASFGPLGQLIKVLPNSPMDGQPATIEITDSASYLASTEDAEEFHMFPGPLVRGETHKNDVLLYCQKMASACKNSSLFTDRESAELLWHFLELLIKQNGMVVGTDVSDLLLEGHEPASTSYVPPFMYDDDPTDQPDLTVSSDRTVIHRETSRESTGPTATPPTDRFRHLLLHGRKKDALDWAVKKNLWGHALFLSSKMDSRTHSAILTKFAHISMKMNDPLQTLYQLMSGRQPAAVTMIAEEKWGDWRPHLGVILSNPTSKPELDKRSIVTLGDTLASRGFLYASQFCYLMAQVPFGQYSRKSSKIVLIGTSHSLSFAEFSHSAAIRCTEVYEYARSLAGSGGATGAAKLPGFTLPSFQTYKLLYTLRLVDFGLLEEALRYCEVIANAVLSSPGLYTSSLVRALVNIASLLKSCDPQRQISEDVEDPLWFQELQKILVLFDSGSIQQQSESSNSPVHGAGGQSTGTCSEVGDILGTQNTTAGGVTAAALNQTYTANGYVYQQYADQSGQWNASVQQQAAMWNTSTGTWNQSVAQQWNQSQILDQSQIGAAVAGDQTQGYGYQATGGWYQQPGEANVVDGGQYTAQAGASNQDQGYIDYTQQQQYDPLLAQGTGRGVVDQTNQYVDQQGYSSNTNTMSGQDVGSGAMVGPPSGPTASISLTSSMNSEFSQATSADTGGAGGTTESTTESDSDTTEHNSVRESAIQHSRGSIGGGKSGSKQDEFATGPPPPPTKAAFNFNHPTGLVSGSRIRTVSSSSNQSQRSMLGNAESGRFNPLSSNSNQPPGSPRGIQMAEPSNATIGQISSVESVEQKKKTKWPGEEDDDNLPKPASKKKEAGSKWFQGWMPFGNKDRPKPMILPDDKNPRIIWDKEKNRYIDLDEVDGGDDTSLKKIIAPPKDFEVSRTVSQAAPLITAISTSLGPGSTPQNKFAKNKTRGARGQYVDVLGASSKPAPTSALLSVPNLPKSVSMPVLQSKIFVPKAIDDDDPSQQQHQIDQQQTHQPTIEETQPSESDTNVAPTNTATEQQWQQNNYQQQQQWQQQQYSQQQLGQYQPQDNTFSQQQQSWSAQQHSSTQPQTDLQQRTNAQGYQESEGDPAPPPMLFNPSQFNGQQSGHTREPPNSSGYSMRNQTQRRPTYPKT